MRFNLNSGYFDATTIKKIEKCSVKRIKSLRNKYHHKYNEICTFIKVINENKIQIIDSELDRIKNKQHILYRIYINLWVQHNNLINDLKNQENEN